MKKICSVFLTFLLLFNTVIPVNIMAEEGDSSTNTDVEVVEVNSEAQETSSNEDLTNNSVDINESETTVEEAEIASESILEENVNHLEEQEGGFVSLDDFYFENETIEEISYPEFNQTKIIDNVKITLDAQEGVFPEGAILSVEKVAVRLEKQVTEVIDQIRDEEKNVAVSYTFDIKVLDKDGNEIQPKDMNKVKVSFEMVEVQNNNLTTEVYHIDDKQEKITSEQVTQLETTTEENIVSVETDSFSLYTVEFTYNNKQYVLEGDSYVKLEDILSSVELTGNIENYEVSNPELFNIFKGNEDGVEYVENYDDNGNLVEYYPINKEDGNTLYMVALQPFTTEEWLKVAIDGIEYTIVVTDAIRVDENGDQVSTSVRYISTTSSASSISTGTNSAITDARVIQGPTEENFTASMPLAEIYIDDTIVNQTLWRNDDLNGTRVIAELLVDNAQGKYKGFKINTDPDVVAGNNMASSYGALYYDFSERYLNDTQTLTVSGSSVNNYERFSGDIVKYTLKGMATKFDPVANEYKNYDVVITYSDILITLAQNSGTGSVNQANVNDRLMLIDTNMVNFKWSGGFRAGLEYSVNVKVVDPDTGTLVDGSYYYPMTDIDVGRTGIGGFANLYNAANVSRYSEQVALLSNYGRPTSTGSWEQKVWIPGGNWSQAPVTNLSNITDEAFPYTSKISSKTIDGQANTLVIEPSRPNGGMTGAIAAARGISPDNHDNSFYSGFITLANNTAGGINVKGWASAPTSGGVESYVLTGSQIVNHKVDASSDVGGTIFTTTTGNADGSLSGGTLLGYNEVNKPFEISAATGQSVTYTMTPKGGYKLKNVWVKDGDIDIMTIVNTAKATVNENDYDTNSDGELDESERQAYEVAVETAINTALASDSDTSAISISSLTSLGKGVYAYTFTGIQENKSIHIDWEKTDLTVTKELDPSMQDINDKFKFRIELSDTTTEETTWRVRAKKNTGTLNYSYPLEDGKPYYMTYYESRTEEVPYKYIVVSDTTDKNPYEESWYYYQNGTYYPTYDTTPASGITYYVKDDTQTSTITNYYHHILGWNETTQTWDDRVITAPNDVTTNVNLGTENLDKELSDNYRFVSDGTHVYSVNSYDEIEDTYTEYLIWVYDDTVSEEVLVIGNLEMYPDGRAFIADYNTPSRYTYIFNDGIEDYSRKIIHYRSNQVIDGVTYFWSSGHYKYEFVEDTNSPVYYNLESNPESYLVDSGYSAVEGESGLYIVTLPAGQNPDTIDLLNNGWEVTVSRVGAIEDDFDLEQAMIQAGATPVLGAVNTFEFEVGVDETIDFNGVIPMGYNYVISEVLPANSRWELLRTSGNDSINDFDGEEHVTFTNTEKRYDITIEKQTVDDIAGSFDFTIEIYREHIDFGRVYGVSIQAYKNSQDVAPTYKLSNSGAPLEISIDNVTAAIPTGDYILNSGNGNLDSLINYLIDMDNSTNHSMYIGSDEAEASTGVHTSLSSQVQEYIDGGYTSFSLEPVGYEFSTMDIVTKIPYIPDILPTGFSGSNGVYTFNLINGESKVFTNIPFGYKYEITETLPQGWENDSKVNEKGTLISDITSTWVNKQKSYSLTINKETVNNDEGTFNFVLVIYGETQFFKADVASHSWRYIDNGNLENYSCAFENQKLTYIHGLEFINSRQGDGYPRYRVAEYFDGIDGEYIWSGSDGGGQYSANDFSFVESSVDTFTYNGLYSNGGALYRPESIKDTCTFVAKAFNSYDIDTQSYTYEIYESKYDPYADNKFFSNDLGFEAHLNEFTLNNDESITIPNIPYGYNYEVYEVDSQGNKVLVGSNIGSTDWKLKSIAGDNNTGTITDDTTVTFTNELLHNLTIKKETIDDKTGSFNFNIKFTKDRVDSTYTKVAQITSAGMGVSGASAYIPGFGSMPTARAKSTLSELEQVGDGPTITNPLDASEQITLRETTLTGTKDGNNWTAYVYINTEKNQYLLYIKTDTITQELYDITNVPNGLNRTSQGTYTFTLANSEELTIFDLPHGVNYEVYEETKDGWQLVDINGNLPSVSKGAGGTSGTLNEDKEEIFNNMPLYDIEVNKTVTGLKGDKNKEFEFTVKVEGWKTIYRDKIVSSNNYYATVENKDNRNATLIYNTLMPYMGRDVYTWYPDSVIQRIEFDMRYRKDGQPVPGYIPTQIIGSYTPTKVDAHGDIDWSTLIWDDGDGEFEVTPSHLGSTIGDSSWTMDWTNAEYASVEMLDYIDLSQYGGISNGDGTYTFKLKDGEHFTLEDIPYGYTYEIVEKDYSSELYTTHVDGANTRTVSGTITEDKSHEYVNDKDYADLTITKNVSGNMGNKNKEFTFRIRVHGWREIFTDTISSLRYHIRNNYNYGIESVILTNNSNNQQALESFLNRYQERDWIEARMIADNATGIFGYGGLGVVIKDNGGSYLNNDDSVTCDVNGGGLYSSVNVESSAAIRGVNENTKLFTLELFEYLDLSEYATYDSSTEDWYPFDGWYTFTLKDGESLIIPDIPVGYTYEIEEVDYSSDGYKTYTDSNIFIQNREITGTLDTDKSHTFRNVNQTAVPTEIRIASYGAGLVGISILVILIIKRNRRKSHAS